jgi:hypothetical protein
MIDVPQLQGGWDPSWHTTVVPFCGTTTVVFFAGGGGLLLLMQPAIRQAAINALANIFMAAPYACHPIQIAASMVESRRTPGDTPRRDPRSYGTLGPTAPWVLRLDCDVVVDRRDAFRVFRDHGREIYGILRGCSPTEPDNAILIGVDLDACQRTQMFCGQFRLYFSGNHRILNEMV